MGLFKGMKDLSEISKMSRQMPRPSIGDALSQSRELMEGLQRSQRLQASGVDGTATVVSVADTGGSLNDHPIARLELDVTLPGQAPYRTTIEQAIPRLQAGQIVPGAVVAVKADPQNPQAVALAATAGGPAAPAAAAPSAAGDPSAPASFAALQASAAAQAAAAQVAAANAGAAQDPATRLERLAELKDKGLLSESEFAAQKARILAEL
ncbi:MAG: SHOCT domain-containing protein [Solirubrobacteraceae bacterium]